MEVKCGVMQYSMGVWKNRTGARGEKRQGAKGNKGRQQSAGRPLSGAKQEVAAANCYCHHNYHHFGSKRTETICVLVYMVCFLFFFLSDYSGWEYNVRAEGQIPTNVHSKKWQLLLKSLIVVLRCCFCQDKCAEAIMEAIIHAFQSHKDVWASLSCFLQECLRSGTSK